MHVRLDNNQNGGGIYQEPIGTFTFNDLATFANNTAFEVSEHAAARVHRSIDCSIFLVNCSAVFM